MKLFTLEKTKNLSKKICKTINRGDNLFLFGEIGTGKTTFARYLINNFELNNKIKRSDILSPTFNIANQYKIKEITIIHYDLFRLKNENEILQLDIFDDNKNVINVIEWPEIIKTRPKNRIEFFFKYTKKTKYRNIFIKGFGKWKKYKFNEI